MRFLNESINTISKEASLFIHEHPEFRDRIKTFEDLVGIRRTLTEDKMIEFIEQFFSKRDRLEYHKKHQDIDNNIYSINCWDFDLETPEVTQINYVVKDGKLFIEGYLTYVGQSYINDTEEEGPVVSAYHDFSIMIPDDAYDIDLYEYDDLECGGYYYEEVE